MTIKKYFCIYRALLVLLALGVRNHCDAFLYQEFEPHRRVPFTEWMIKLQEPLFEQWRKLFFVDIERHDVHYKGEEHHYLFRQGETLGIVIMFHGVLGRKEFYYRLVKALIKREKPLPTLLIPDLPGHGSQPYPVDQNFSMRRFTHYMAEFIRYTRERYPDQPIIVLGHSLSGGFSLMLSHLEQLIPDGLILVSPAGFDGDQVPDFKSKLEDANGFPYDFDSPNAREIYRVSSEPSGLVTRSFIFAFSHLYALVASPYETDMKTKLFRQLVVSGKQLVQEQSPETYLKQSLAVPAYLIWGNKDQMFDRSRYQSLNATLSICGNLKSHEVSGSHLWLYEQADEAAELIGEMFDQLLSNNCSSP